MLVDAAVAAVTNREVVRGLGFLSALEDNEI